MCCVLFMLSFRKENGKNRKNNTEKERKKQNVTTKVKNKIRTNKKKRKEKEKKKKGKSKKGNETTKERKSRINMKVKLNKKKNGKIKNSIQIYLASSHHPQSPNGPGRSPFLFFSSGWAISKVLGVRQLWVYRVDT